MILNTWPTVGVKPPPRPHDPEGGPQRHRAPALRSGSSQSLVHAGFEQAVEGYCFRIDERQALREDPPPQPSGLDRARNRCWPIRPRLRLPPMRPAGPSCVLIRKLNPHFRSWPGNIFARSTSSDASGAVVFQTPGTLIARCGSSTSSPRSRAAALGCRCPCRHGAASAGTTGSRAPCRTAPPPPMKNSGSCGISNSIGSSAPSALARLHADQPRPLVGPMHEAGIRHAERREDVLAQIDVERLAAHRLDRLADPVDVDAVLPALARIERERRRQRRILAGDDARQIGMLHVSAVSAFQMS